MDQFSGKKTRHVQGVGLLEQHNLSSAFLIVFYISWAANNVTDQICLCLSTLNHLKLKIK